MSGAKGFLIYGLQFKIILEEHNISEKNYVSLIDFSRCISLASLK